MDREILKQAGIDYERGAARFSGDTELYEALLEAFLTQDDSFDGVPEAFARRDYEKLFHCAHTIKGMAGNLELKRLFDAACALTDLLRGNPQPDEAKAVDLYAALESAYAAARDGVAAAMEH